MRHYDVTITSYVMEMSLSNFKELSHGCITITSEMAKMYYLMSEGRVMMVYIFCMKEIPFPGNRGT
jgi:hypothetical protein